MTLDNKSYKTFQKLVVGKNINPQTLLATDYLNHFNEIHMLLGMIAEMPDCLEDILEWKKKSYQQHFMDSGFQDKEIAIEAYDYSPDKYKLKFEKCVSEMEQLLLDTIGQVEKYLTENEIDQVNAVVNIYSPKMEHYIEQCSSIINSQEVTTQQDSIDDLFNDVAQDEISNTTDQSSIDDLFD